MAGAIVEGRQVAQDRTLTPEFCIIGSGAAGGVCALKLAEAGFEVLVLEEGPNIPKEKGPAPGQERKMLNEHEAEMYKLLYQEGATRLTKNGGIKVLQGRCLGGGTAVNWSACLPPRLETLDEWQKRGLPFTRQNLEPYLREVVNYLPIVRNDKYNTSARKFMLGCARHDLPHENLPNNTHKCRECGSCGVGCPYDRKMSGFVKWLPDAVALGATIYTDTKVDRLVGSNDRINEVQAHFIDGKTRPTQRRLVVKPTKGVVLAAGAIGTPSVLLRSQLDLGKRVGKFTHIHPVTITIGKYPEKTLPAYGVPDNMWTPKFAPGPTGYLIETGSFFPVLSASATLQHGAELHRIMRDYYPTGAISYAHHTTGFDDKEKYGTVELDDNGDPQLDYKIPSANVKPMQESLVMMARIHLAAGATSVYIMRNPPLEVKPGDNFEAIRKINFTEPQRATIFTVHVMGGCQMNKDEKRRCVNNDFTFKGKKNLWVVDGSIFPTALGANPQVTIYSLALWAAREICELNQKVFKLNHQQGGTAVAGLLEILEEIARPKKRAEVVHGQLENLNDKTALILFAVAEAVLGENFLLKAPKFTETVDDYLNYQRPAQRDQFLTALLLAETRIFNFIVGGHPEGFSHMSLAERQKTLEQLRSSNQQQGRNIYAAFVNVSASTYYASELTWPDLTYAGVSVDHPEILNQPPPIPWRPTDPRPVEP